MLCPDEPDALIHTLNGFTAQKEGVMELKEFTKKICKAMERELGEECRVQLREVPKNNGVVLHGLLLFSGERNVIPTIYLETFWEAYEGGVTFAEIVDRLVEIYRREACAKSIDMDFFREFDKVKDRICYRLVGKKDNEGLLADVPHVGYLDLAICFFYAYSGEELGEGSILIHHSHAEMWNTNTSELLELAGKNTPILFPARSFSMEELLGEAEDELTQEEYQDFLHSVPMKILSNEKKNQGAGCLLYEGVLESMAREYNGDFYLLPSSIHETIVLPDNGAESAESLRRMVYEVNRSQVLPEEVLSDSLYYYSRERKRLEIVS